MSQETKQYKKATKVDFLSIETFKRVIGCDILEIVHNAKSDAISVLDKTNDKFYRCQAGIDFDLPMSFLIPDDNRSDACLVNVKNASPLTTLRAL